MRKLTLRAVAMLVAVVGLGVWHLSGQAPWISNKAVWRSADGPIRNDDGSSDYVLTFPHLNLRGDHVAKEFWVLRFPENAAIEAVEQTAIAFHFSQPENTLQIGDGPDDAKRRARVSVETNRQAYNLRQIDADGRKKQFLKSLYRNYEVRCAIDEEVEPGFFELRSLTPEERAARVEKYPTWMERTWYVCEEHRNLDGFYITDRDGAPWGGAVCNLTEPDMCHISALSSQNRFLGFTIHKENLWDVRDLTDAVSAILDAATVAEFVDEVRADAWCLSWASKLCVPWSD